MSGQCQSPSFCSRLTSSQESVSSSSSISYNLPATCLPCTGIQLTLARRMANWFTVCVCTVHRSTHPDRSQSDLSRVWVVVLYRARWRRRIRRKLRAENRSRKRVNGFLGQIFSHFCIWDLFTISDEVYVFIFFIVTDRKGSFKGLFFIIFWIHNLSWRTRICTCLIIYFILILWLSLIF